MSELKPASPGEYLGQSSPHGEWEWDGTGRSDDDWIPVSVPTPQVSPTLTAAHVRTMAVMDFANASKFSLPTLPGTLTWVYVGQCWARHDIIRVAGL